MSRNHAVMLLAGLMLALAGPSLAEEEARKRVLVYGDSHTYGSIATLEMPVERHKQGVPWPQVLQELMGEEVEIVAEGLSGRTTDVDAALPMAGIEFNGAKMLPAVLASHTPVDVVVIMLGTNDLLTAHNRSALRIALGAGILVDQARSAPQVGSVYPAPEVLLVAPQPTGPKAEEPPFGEFFAGSVAKSAQFGELYKAVAEMAGVEFLDAGSVVSASTVDGVHLDEDGHSMLAEAVAGKLEAMLAD
ncbi:SGNH/GDSL hydrolase family protein [Devosia nitrariae]|uniref:Hydrolase n=1 Tax=Devosia nitrariae TaxID=2071872 RepID=A0ABQ5W387_9HYPH|nr:SGNH/GDSL hydrolase family protein [Devosia nitrariae]GLQ54523.1 hydrolase [Devosia nitrariae]